MNDLGQRRNKSHRAFFEDRSRWLISFGGAGSAKSYSAAQKILLDRIMLEPNHKYLICRKVARTLRVSVFQLFKDLISDLVNQDPEILNDFKINKSDMTITYLPNNSMLLFFGLDDIEKLKSIQGISGIWIEEASETERGDILELNRRLRGNTTSYKQIIITFNPISHLHWLKGHFFDNPSSKASIYKTTYLDNSFIDDEYKQELEDIKDYDIQQYNIYALGEWGVLNTNIVYHKFDYKVHISPYGIKDFNVLHIGIDFNVGGCACVICGEKGKDVHIVGYIAPYDTEAVVNELSIYQDTHNITLYPDASGDNSSTSSSKTDIQLLRDAGFNVNTPPGNGAIKDRINSVNKKFSLGECFVSADLDKVSYALQSQTYLDNGKPEKSDNHKGGAIDDINDALGYYIVRRHGIVTNKIHGYKKKTI